MALKPPAPPTKPRCQFCLMPDQRGNPLVVIKVGKHICAECTRFANGQHAKKQRSRPDYFDPPPTSVHGDGAA